MTASEWCARAAVVLSGGVAPWSFAADCAPVPCLQLCGSAPHGLPSLDPEQWRIRCSNNLKILMMLTKVMASERQGGGSSEPRIDDFPSAEGLPPIQGVSGAAAAARHRHVLFVFGGVEFQRDFVVFSLFVLDLSVRTLV